MEQLLGPLGLLVGALLALGSKMRGDWVTRDEMARETRRADRAELQRDRLLLVVLELKGATVSMLEALKEAQGNGQPESRGETS